MELKSCVKGLLTGTAASVILMSLSGCSSFRMEGWNNCCDAEPVKTCAKPDNSCGHNSHADWDWDYSGEQRHTHSEKVTHSHSNGGASHSKHGFMMHEQPREHIESQGRQFMETQGHLPERESHFWEDRYGR